jgi:hypothetical protein
MEKTFQACLEGPGLHSKLATGKLARGSNRGPVD